MWWRVFLLWIYNESVELALFLLLNIAPYRTLNWFDWKLGHCGKLNKLYTPTVRFVKAEVKRRFKLIHIIGSCFEYEEAAMCITVTDEYSCYTLTTYNWNETTLAYFMFITYLYVVLVFSSFIRFVALFTV